MSVHARYLSIVSVHAKYLSIVSIHARYLRLSLVSVHARFLIFVLVVLVLYTKYMSDQIKGLNRFVARTLIMEVA
jgi:hypothetical protein